MVHNCEVFLLALLNVTLHEDRYFFASIWAANGEIL